MTNLDDLDDIDRDVFDPQKRFSSPVSVHNTGCLTVTVSDHFIAVLVAQSLKLPMPVNEISSRVLRTLMEDPDDPSTSNVTFQYLDETKSDTITLEVTPRQDRGD
jgi:hypothetical protein